jgi:hypothetical protein
VQQPRPHGHDDDHDHEGVHHELYDDHEYDHSGDDDFVDDRDHPCNDHVLDGYYYYEQLRRCGVGR